MLLKGVEIQVYKIDNTTFEPIGQVNKFTSLIWPDKFNGYTTFELNAPVNAENKSLIKKGNVIWCGGDNAAVIEIIQSDMNEEGQKVYKVKGRTLEMLLTTRIIWGMYSCTNKIASTAMYEMVNANCVNTSLVSRKIPFLECADDDFFGKRIYFQKTGGEVYDALQSVSVDAELGFCVLFRPKEKKLIFKVLQGVDRANGDASNRVIFSTDLEDILSSSYYTNDQDIKSVAYVAGEGEGDNRKKIISGDDESLGFMRRELYVDAKDLQSEIYNEDGTVLQMAPDEYLNMLNDRGNEKLAERAVVESFEATMRVVGDVQYRFGVDYNNGDKVVVQDNDLGIQVIATVSEICENFDDKYSLDITFGFSYPTLIQKVKQQIL